MRYSSAANRDASSPPAPARISIMTFFSSFGSLGVNRMNNSSSSAPSLSSISVTSVLASSASSSFPVANSLASSRFWANCSRSFALPMSVSNSENRLFFVVKSGALYASGRARNSPRLIRSDSSSGRLREICVIPLKIIA